jgi:hypothetical protein
MKARHLGDRLSRLDEVVRNVHTAGRHQHGTADCHATRHRKTEDLNRHC